MVWSVCDEVCETLDKEESTAHRPERLLLTTDLNLAVFVPLMFLLYFRYNAHVGLSYFLNVIRKIGKWSAISMHKTKSLFHSGW